MTDSVIGELDVRQSHAVNPFADQRMQELADKWAKRGGQGWWQRADIGRTFEMSCLRTYTGREDLSVEEVLADPLAYDQLYREWRLCERCVKQSPPLCPQAAGGSPPGARRRSG